MNTYINKYIDYINNIKNYSNYTIINYEKDLDQFYIFLKTKNIDDLNKIEYETIREYLYYLNTLKYQNKTICRMISTLRSFFKYLKSEDIIKINPMILITNPKKEIRLPNYLYINEIEQLLNVEIKDKFDLRNLLIIELLYSTGIRVSEAINIKISDINEYDKKIKILGKGNKERYVLYGSKFDILYKRYMKEFINILKPNNDYLLVSNNKKQLTTGAIRQILVKMSKKANLKKHIYPHMLRHTCATHMLNGGAEILSVKELLGHKNIASTGIYTHVTNERLRAVYLNSHPRAKR